MKLTELKIRNIKTAGKYPDGAGLYFDYTAAAGRYWRYRYRFDDKQKMLALGVYPETTLKQAREHHSAALALLSAGTDPSAQRKADKAQQALETERTLRTVCELWLGNKAARWTPDTRAAIEAGFKNNIYPALGHKPIAYIKPSELRQAIQVIEKRGAGELAARVLQRIKAVYSYAISHDLIESNPMIDLKGADILPARREKHRAALPAKDLPAFMAQLAAYEGDPATANALRLLMLTATRPSETRCATWAEFDLDAKLWTIPAERMKMRVAHTVPLSLQALAVLDTMRPLCGSSGLVFASPYYPSKPLSENTFNSAIARMGYKNEATAHGFRALFSTVANEAGWAGDVIERQLAHIEGNKVRAAYHRSTYMRDRTRLMNWWAEYLDAAARGLPVPAVPV